MTTSRLRPLATLLFPVLLLAGCSTSSKSGGGTLYVESCSLGCTNGVGGDQVFCSVVNVYQNQEFAITFSEPVDLASVNASSFRVVNVGNGTSPVGTFVVDSSKPQKLIFRPDLTFDALGNPEFGLLPDTAYQITVPGVRQGDSPPFIESTEGRPNQSRLECTILTDQGIVDLVPGPPTVVVEILTESSVNCDSGTTSEELLPLVETLGVPADGATDVCSLSPIVFTFQDVMFVASLLNPTTREATFITVKVDADGELATIEDRAPVSGSYSYSLDLASLTTTLVFFPSEGFPSAGTSNRRIVIEIPDGVIDLAENSVTPSTGGGTLSFIPEFASFPPVEIFEDFADDSNLDPSASGSSSWVPNRVKRGVLGSSGRMGRLLVRAGQNVVLDTDSQVFPLPNDPLDVMGNPDGTGAFPTTVTAVDGIFEFSSVRVEPGGTLSFTGSLPPRLLARGPIEVLSGGFIDLRGSSASAHDASIPKTREAATEVRGLGGPNAGDGGWGGDRWDAAGPQRAGLRAVGAIENTGAVTDGEDANGVGNAPGVGSGGVGGPQYPALFPPTDDLGQDSDPPMPGDIAWVLDFELQVCDIFMVGNAGSGGGYALPSDPAQTSTTPEFSSDPPDVPNAGPATPGAGTVANLLLEPPNIGNFGYEIRTLHPNPASDGGILYPFLLRGGSGGGGGGMHPKGGQSFSDIFGSACLPSFAGWIEWHDHSGASGGGGGGAIQLGSDALVNLQGRIDASGGDGGSSLNPGSAEVEITTDFASPGGGGSGGAVLIQGPTVQVANVTSVPRIDVTGGTAGVAQGVSMIVSGSDGSPGLIRIEDLSSRTNLAMNLELSPRFAPFDDGAVDGDFDADGDWVGPGNSVPWLSCAPGDLEASQYRPETLTGVVSCWYIVPGNFYAINFGEDSGPDPDQKGWNMDVYYQGTSQANLIPFRGDDHGLFGGNDFETEFGNEINTAADAIGGVSPIAVRFQGARLTGNIPDPCSIDLNSANVVFGSVSPWVDHPALLNDTLIQPNAIRFTIVFDHAPEVGAVANDVRGVTNITISAAPD